MLDVMLCGARDTQLVRSEFRTVIDEFGGSPLHYLDGRILYVNSATASWDKNSRATVESADLCVFVIVRELGAITWRTEFLEVVSSGKPFVVLCLDETYARYLSLLQSAPSTLPSDPADTVLVSTLGMLEREYQVTVIQFPHNGFREQLRRQLGALLRVGLGLIEQRNKREFLLTLFSNPRALSAQQIEWTIELAADDFADKNMRKRAILALAQRSAAPEELVSELLDSPEQGVQRLVFDRLADLYPHRPPTQDLLRRTVEIANKSTDVGIGRRLIATLFTMSVPGALLALSDLDLVDVGLRSRIVDQLEAHEDVILAENLKDPAVALARRCETGPRSSRWQDRLKAFIARHADETSGPG